MGENRLLRFRLFFDDRRLLKKEQRSDGLRRCWILLKPGIATVADLASDIGERFGIRDRIVLSIDDFVLPVFESTCIIKEKDVISIKKEVDEQTNICAPCDAQNPVHDSPSAKVHYCSLSTDILTRDSSQENYQGNGSNLKEIMVSPMENASNVGSSNIESAKRNREYMNNLPGTKRNKQEGGSTIKQICSTKCAFENMLSSQSTTFTPVNDKSQNGLPLEGTKTVDRVGSDVVPCRARGQVKEISHDLKSQSDIPCNNPKIYQSSDGKEDIVQVVVRPGHIRFVPRDHIIQRPGETKNPELYSETSTKSIPNNQDKAFYERNESCYYHRPDVETIVNGECLAKNPEMMSSVNGVSLAKLLIDFESLPSLCRLPRECDIIAYRYVELSSSVFPELSAPQVGKVSSFDDKSLEIKLTPVLDYEILLNENPNGTISQKSVSIYKEDGSLEIEYPSLVDVRLLKAHDSEQVASHVDPATKNNWEPATKNNWEPARKDNWEPALAKGNWNEPNASLQERSNGWDQWIPSKNTNSTYSSAGRSNQWNNWTPSSRNTTNWTPNRGRNNWNPKNKNSATTSWSSKVSKPAAPSWRFHQNKFNPHRGKYSGPGKY